jgi:hypothetical protein
MYSNLIVDKNIEDIVFSGLTIKQPITICKLIENEFYSKKLIPIEFSQIRKQILDLNCDKIFVKPALGYGGNNIYIFKRNKNSKFKNQFDMKFNENFFKTYCKGKDYIIQAGISQHKYLSEIYPNSINSMRIITENKSGIIRILYAILRMGRNKSELDNINQNGIFTDINLENGKLGEFACSENCEKFNMHPDTKFVFKNSMIPKWNTIKDFVLGSAEKLAMFTYLAWDIALTSEGPLVIEANLNYGIDGWQIIRGGLREIYRIEDPNYYWRNKGKRI